MPRRKKRQSDSEIMMRAPKQLTPRSKNQALLMDTIKNNLITFATGPSGTGKTALSVSMAVEHLFNGLVDKIILSRPILEVGGKSMGYFPGDPSEKVSYYLVPLQSELQNICTKEMLNNMEIEIVPLGLMRGRTFKNSFVVVDESQNASYEELKMLCTRFGEGSRMVISGDTQQSDLPKYKQNDFARFVAQLKGLDLVGTVEMGREDIVRHEIVGRILDRLDSES